MRRPCTDHALRLSLRAKCRVQDVSALTGDGLRDGLQWLVDKIRKSDRAVLLRQRL